MEFSKSLTTSFFADNKISIVANVIRLGLVVWLGLCALAVIQEPTDIVGALPGGATFAIWTYMISCFAGATFMLLAILISVAGCCNLDSVMAILTTVLAILLLPVACLGCASLVAFVMLLCYYSVIHATAAGATFYLYLWITIGTACGLTCFEAAFVTRIEYEQLA